MRLLFNQRQCVRYLKLLAGAVSVCESQQAPLCRTLFAVSQQPQVMVGYDQQQIQTQCCSSYGDSDAGSLCRQAGLLLDFFPQADLSDGCSRGRC